jgi:hypothetical protein
VVGAAASDRSAAADPLRWSGEALASIQAHSERIGENCRQTPVTPASEEILAIKVIQSLQLHLAECGTDLNDVTK